MATPASGAPIPFSNEDVKTNLCSKAQSSLNALALLMKSIVKTSRSNDYLSATLKQFSNCDPQIVSAEERIKKIETMAQQIRFQSDILQLDTQELNQIQQTFNSMNLDDH
jgi:hypothetical protein